MSEWKIPLAAVAVGAAFVGVNEQITWILYPLGALLALAAGGLLLRSSGVTVPVFHGHAGAPQVLVNHEKRHRDVAEGLGIRVDGIEIRKVPGGYNGTTLINRSAANIRRWQALSPAEKAAIPMAGAMGPEGNSGCDTDLAEVDSYGVSRGAARRVARRHL